MGLNGRTCIKQDTLYQLLKHKIIKVCIVYAKLRQARFKVYRSRLAHCEKSYLER